MSTTTPEKLLALAYAGLRCCVQSWWPFLADCDPQLVPHLRVRLQPSAPPARKMGVAIHTERVAPATLTPAALFEEPLAAAALARSAGRVAVVVSVELEDMLGVVCLVAFADCTIGRA